MPKIAEFVTDPKMMKERVETILKLLNAECRFLVKNRTTFVNQFNGIEANLMPLVFTNDGIDCT